MGGNGEQRRSRSHGSKSGSDNRFTLLANKDAADLDYLPELTLTGALGGSSEALKDLLSNPVGTLGADITLPFLQ